MKNKIQSIINECKRMSLLFDNNFYITLYSGRLPINEHTDLITLLIKNLPADLELVSIQYYPSINATIGEIQCRRS